MKHERLQKGITLIALVITIIITLILAGVSINAITGENVLLSRAKNAKESTRAAYVQEQIDLAVSNNKIENQLSSNEITTQEKLVQKLLGEGILNEYEATLLETNDTIEIGEKVLDFSVLAEESFKIVGTEGYSTISECIAEAKEGEKIIIDNVISNENVVIDKSVEITSKKDLTLNNVTFTVNGTNVELKVSNLNFEGTSYINANNAKALFVENVTANVILNSTDAVTNSRAAFISLGASELNDMPLLIKLSKNNIVVTGNNNPVPVLGWRYIADGSILIDNTFGADGKNNFEAIKLMNFMNDAVITLKNNTAYVWGNGFCFSQNNSRTNEYTAIIEGNTFIGSGADYVWVEMNGTGTILSNIIANNNKVGNEDFKVTDIKTQNRNILSGVINLSKDEEGKIISGTYSPLTDTQNIENIKGQLANGYTLMSNADGSYSVVSEN